MKVHPEININESLPNEENVRYQIPPSESTYKDYDRLDLPIKNGCQIITFASIIYCKLSSNYTHIMSGEDRALLISKTLKWTAEKLPLYFLRVHHSYVVNMLKVRKYEFANQQLVLNSSCKIPVSRSYKNTVQ